MSMAHDEKSFFSAGWDGVALVSLITYSSQKFVHLKTFPGLGLEYGSNCPEFLWAWLPADSDRRSAP